MADLFWLSHEQRAAIEPFMPKNQSGPEKNDDRQVISLRGHSVPASCTCSPQATDGAIAQRGTVRAPPSTTGSIIIIDPNEDEPTHAYCPRGAHNRYTERKLLIFKRLKLIAF